MSHHLSTHERHSIALTGQDGSFRKLSEIEAEVIKSALHYYHGQMSEVARRLGIGRSTLYRRINELGIKFEKPTEDYSLAAEQRTLVSTF